MAGNGRSSCTKNSRSSWLDLPYPAFCPITQKGSKARLIPFEAVEEILGPRQPAGVVFCELGSTPEAIYAKLTACWRCAVKQSKIEAHLHDLRHTFGSALRRTMSKEDVASTMGISSAIARAYLDHESADLTRRAFAKPGTNSARSAGVTGSETSQG